MLQRISEAPERGYILVMWRGGAHFGTWEGSLPETPPLTELHIFDETREYRCVWSQARGRYVEAVITEPDLPYTEDVMLLKGEPERYLTLRNYFDYDEEDLLYLAAYRLTGVQEGGR